MCRVGEQIYAEYLGISHLHIFRVKRKLVCEFTTAVLLEFNYPPSFDEPPHPSVRGLSGSLPLSFLRESSIKNKPAF